MAMRGGMQCAPSARSQGGASADLGSCGPVVASWQWCGVCAVCGMVARFAGLPHACAPALSRPRAQWPVVARRRREYGRWRMLKRTAPCTSLLTLTQPCPTVSGTARREGSRACARPSRRTFAAGPGNGWPDGGVGPARKAPSNSGRPGVEGPVRTPAGSGEGCGKDAANGVAEVGESGAQGEREQCRRLARGPSRLRGGRLPSGTLTEWLDRPSQISHTRTLVSRRRVSHRIWTVEYSHSSRRRESARSV